MTQILAQPEVQDAVIVAAIAVVAAVIVAAGLVFTYRRFQELSGHSPKRRR